uniref:Small integral membrane protein 14 n=1 Tax=Seriola lalandi dorsalis TaxID=1841481 RepID=A0A3B4WK16_SERLL
MCVCSVPGPSGQVGGGGDLTLPMVLMGWVVVALVLFLLRPSSLRGPRPTGKPTGPHNVSTYRTYFISQTMSSHM